MLPSPAVRVQSNFHRGHGILFDDVWLGQASENSLCGSIQMFGGFISSIEDSINPWSLAAHSHIFQQLWIAQKGLISPAVHRFVLVSSLSSSIGRLSSTAVDTPVSSLWKTNFCTKPLFTFLLIRRSFKPNVVAQFAILHIWVRVVPCGN